MLRSVIATIFVLGTAGSAWSQSGTALLIANTDYERLRDARGATVVLQSVSDLEAGGFSVDQATDLSTNTMRAAFAGLSEDLRSGTDPRVIVVFAGRVVHATHGAWLLGTEARVPDFTTLDSYGVRLETVLALAGARQGGAVVVIADMGLSERLPAGITAGLPATVQVPQGVTLVQGAPSAVTAFLRDLMEPGQTVGAALNARPQLTLQGFNPPYMPFLTAPITDEPPAPPVDLDGQAWDAALAADTVEGYQDYLAAFPQGRFAADAQAGLTRLLNTPERIEAGLNLTRDERRAIQRDLTILGFDPRGIDGVFGRGTRTAISGWQGANRYPQTGFLNRDQIFDMAQQGARRAAQLEAEARARAAEEERRDRTYWRDTGSGSDEVGLRAYLDRYPQGIFATVARDRLNQIEADRRRQAEAADRAAWAQVQAIDTIPAYDAYLRDYPQGLFAAQARARIAQLDAPTIDLPEIEPPFITEAREAEEALNIPPFTRAMIERRLLRMGLNPGRPDGVFDDQTRAAIADWQAATGLRPTGYLSADQVANLMAQGILDILR